MGLPCIAARNSTRHSAQTPDLGPSCTLQLMGLADVWLNVVFLRLGLGPTMHCFFPVQIFTKGSVHAVIRLGKSTFKTRAVRAAPTVAWQETGYLYVRCGSSLTASQRTLARR